MDASRILTVARLEAGEVWRDPQVAWTLASIVALAHVLLIAGGAASPDLAAFTLVLVAPLGLLLLAGPRRGVASEDAFRRIVLTCPITRDEWLAGRLVGLQAFTTAYALLVLPAFVLEVAASGAVIATTLDSTIALAALSCLGGLVGLALGDSTRLARAPMTLALVVFGALVLYRAPGWALAVEPGVPRRVLLVVISTLPPVQLMFVGVFVGYLDAPSWAIAVAFMGTLALGVAIALNKRRGLAALAWLAGAVALGSTAHSASSPVPSGLASDGFLPVFGLLALVPASVAIVRSRMK